VEYGLHVLGFVQTPDKRNRQFITQNLGDFAMRWRDIRFEKPTEADGGDYHQILVRRHDGTVAVHYYSNVFHNAAWMPLSELPAFEPIPDPPDGWRFVDKENDARDDQAKFWDEETKHWGLVNPHLNHWLSTHTYIVPVDPPEPQYRPFANAAEFEPYCDKWVLEGSRKCRPTVYCDTFVEVNGTTYEWDEALLVLKLTDGTPFGVRVDQ
jgi:hypothetical protein